MHHVSPQKIPHVVHIIPTLAIGGAEKFVLELTKHIDVRELKQSIVTFWDDSPFLTSLPAHVEHTHINFFDIPYTKRIAILARYLKDNNVDVVHTHLFSADLWGRLAARRAGIPVITTEHNINKAESFLWTMIKRCMRRMSHVYTAPSQAVADFMSRVYHIDKLSIQIIRHGIDISVFSQTLDAQFVQPYRIGLVGRVVEQKGHKIAIDALTYLSDISCRFVFRGNGQTDELQRYAQQQGVDEHIEWSQATVDEHDIYADIDILIVPSLWEGLGLIVLEAMASKRIVIASNIDGLKENIDDAVTGFFVPVEDAQALAEKIRFVLDNEKKRKHIVDNAYTWVCQHASIDKMAKQYQKLYSTVCTTTK